MRSLEEELKRESNNHACEVVLVVGVKRDIGEMEHGATSGRRTQV